MVWSSWSVFYQRSSLSHLPSVALLTETEKGELDLIHAESQRQVERVVLRVLQRVRSILTLALSGQLLIKTNGCLLFLTKAERVTNKRSFVLSFRLEAVQTG